MSWDPAMVRKINVFFEADDLPEFSRLLRAHPEYLRDLDGTDLWMWRAAIDGKLATIQLLAELGLDVNTPKDLYEADNPYYTAEGAILHASAEGHLEVVRWLLEHGAKVNYTVHGQSRCLPLLRAAASGHLDVIKLLVQHGADVKATWNGLDALTQAENYGQQEVCDYLWSVTDTSEPSP